MQEAFDLLEQSFKSENELCKRFLMSLQGMSQKQDRKVSVPVIYSFICLWKRIQVQQHTNEFRTGY